MLISRRGLRSLIDVIVRSYPFSRRPHDRVVVQQRDRLRYCHGYVAVKSQVEVVHAKFISIQLPVGLQGLSNLGKRGGGVKG